MKVNFQLGHPKSLYKAFHQDVKTLAKYHSEPVAFLVGQFAAKLLRVNPSSKVGKKIQDAETRFKLTRPYVG